MPITNPVVGYTSLTQRVGLALETGAAPGETLLMPSTLVAATMSLIAQPNTVSATVGMHLHFLIVGATTTGTIIVAGTGPAGSVTSITYHVPVSPQNQLGYTEITTKEAFLTVNASGITTTGMTGAQLLVYGTFAGKFLIPISLDKEEKITHHAPQDKRGILFKNLRVVQLTKAIDIAKFDSDLYPDSLWAPYTCIGNTPTITTIPAAPTSLLAATPIAATMTLTTQPVTPGEFLIFSLTSVGAAGTIVVGGTDPFGNPYASNETITIAASPASQTLYSTRRYSVVNTSSLGVGKFTTTGGTGASVTITGVYAWQYSYLYDGINNITPYSSALEVYDGVMGFAIPGFVPSDLTLDWQKEKEILLQVKGSAQDLLIVGDPTATTFGTNPFATLSQPTTLPYVSWPASFYIDNGSGGAPLTTQDGSMLTYKFTVTTGRKWIYAGDGQQRPSFVTWEAEHDFSVDATIVDIGYANYNTYFKPNMPVILSAQFQGTFLGNIANTNYYELVQIITPAKVDSWKFDQTKNPVEGTLKLMANYDFQNLGYAYKYVVIAQVPPTYIN